MKNIELSKANIIRLHDLSIKKYGGDYGIRDNDLLDFIAQAPYQESFGVPLFPSVFDKAAKYLISFANYQVFYDGNKRTGALTSSVLLKLQGYNLDINSDNFYNLVMSCANSNISDFKDNDKLFTQVSRYLQENCIDLTKQNTKKIEFDNNNTFFFEKSEINFEHEMDYDEKN